MSTKHTPGRLKIDEHTGWIVTEGDPYGHGPMHVADVRGWGHLTGAGACNLDEETAYAIQQANAQRIVATWNACEGVPTEALEASVVREMIEALELVLYQFDTPGYRHKLAVEKTRDVLRKLRGEASSTATNHDEEYEEWLRRAEEERYYNEYGREA